MSNDKDTNDLLPNMYFRPSKELKDKLNHPTDD